MTELTLFMCVGSRVTKLISFLCAWIKCDIVDIVPVCLELL